MTGQIIKILKNEFVVSSNKNNYTCTLRGKLKTEGITPKVGDYVFFELENKAIERIEPRKNSLDRPSVSNIDIALIVTSITKKEFSTNLLDKLLIICEINNITPVICLTKKDLLTKEEKKEIKSIIKYYKKIGYKVLYNTNIYRIKKLFKNKTTVLTGQTGSGKSTLMNKLNKELNFETNEISKALGRGVHTTRCVTLVEMYKGKVLDTPGFSLIDLTNYSNIDIRRSFPEFNKINCPYKDCNHINEKDCQVKKEVEKGNILKSRYTNYLKFVERR